MSTRFDKKIVANALLALALTFGAAPLTAFAQEHGGESHPGERAENQAADEANQAESEHEHEEAPEAINWTQFGGTRTDAHGETKPNPPPFVATLVNFAVLLVLLYLGITRVVNPALQTRRAAIEAELGEAQRLRAEAEAMHRTYTERLEKMDAEFAAMQDEFRKAGEQEFNRIVEEAKVRAERMQRETEQALAQEMSQLRSDLMREAVEAAASSAEQAVRTNINTQDQGRLADDYLSALEKTPGTPGVKSGASA